MMQFSSVNSLWHAVSCCDILWPIPPFFPPLPLQQTVSCLRLYVEPMPRQQPDAQPVSKPLEPLLMEWPLFQTSVFNCRWVVLGFGNSVSSCLIRKKWCVSRATTKKLHPRFAGYLFQASHVAPWHKYFRMQPMAPKLSEKTWRDFIMSSSTWVYMLNLVGTSMLGSLDSAMIRKVANTPGSSIQCVYLQESRLKPYKCWTHISVISCHCT